MKGGRLCAAAAPRQLRISSLQRTYGRVSCADITEEAPPPPPWGDIPDNIIFTISGFLRCRADRIHMAFVNKHWRASMMGLQRPPPPLLPPLPPLPPQLPWLIFPSTSAPTFYSTIGDRYHRLHGLPADVSVARCRGSGDGGWLFVALPASQAYVLYNLNSGGRIPLPSVCRNRSYDKSVTAMPLAVLSATLSASPSRGPYVVAAIGIVTNYPAIAFWQEGCASWSGARLPVTPQDVIYSASKGGFLFLMPDEKLLFFRTTPRPNGGIHLSSWFWDVQQRATYHSDMFDMYMQEVVVITKRYLVESRGELLMVVRLAFVQSLGTFFLRVLKLEVLEEEAVPGGGQRRIWQEIDDLDGRLLFLGVGCSRSVEVAHYDGFRASMAYFLHESTVHDPGSMYDVVPDTGRYSMSNFVAKPWPPGGPGHKPRSDVAPVWWLQ